MNHQQKDACPKCGQPKGLEARQCLKCFRKTGPNFSPEALKKMSAWQKGRKLTPEHCAKLSAAHLGLKRHPLSLELKQKLSLALRGKKHSQATRAKMSVAHRMEKNANWRGGRYITDDGYVMIRCLSHPHANAVGYVLEHRLVMEAHLGRVLLPTEIVHHINGIKDDNRIENLLLFASNSDHVNHHHQARARG